MAQQNKNSLTNGDTIQDIERKLMPRLRFMAYLFFLLALASFLFACFTHAEEQQKMSSFHQEQNRLLLDIEAILNRYGGGSLFSDMESLELSFEDVFNFYVVALLFGTIGISLFYFSSNGMPPTKSKIDQNNP